MSSRRIFALGAWSALSGPRGLAILVIITIWTAVAIGIAMRSGSWHVIAQQPAPCVSPAPAYVGASEDGAIGLIGTDCVLRWWKR